MSLTILPQTRSGKWTAALAAITLLVFAAWQIGLAVERHRQAVWDRLHPAIDFHPPLLYVFNWNLVGYVAVAMCVTTSIVGIVSSFKDRSVVVWAITLAGVVILLLILGNLLFPHQTPF